MAVLAEALLLSLQQLTLLDYCTCLCFQYSLRIPCFLISEATYVQTISTARAIRYTEDCICDLLGVAPFKAFLDDWVRELSIICLDFNAVRFCLIISF